MVRFAFFILGYCGDRAWVKVTLSGKHRSALTQLRLRSEGKQTGKARQKQSGLRNLVYSARRI
jgi:hypothetical protein